MRSKTWTDQAQKVWVGWKEETCRPSLPGLLTRLLFIAFGLFVVWDGAAFGPVAAAQTGTPSVSVSVDRTEVTIGDPIRYTISVTAAAGVEVEIPLLGKQLGSFVVLDFGELPPRDENGQVVTSRWFRLTTFQTGRHLLPGPTVGYRQPTGERERVDGNDVSITVISLLAQSGQNPTLRDIKPPEVPPFDWRPYGLVAVAGLVLVGLGGGLLFSLRRPAPSVAPPAPPAYQVALQALRRLHARGLIEKQQFETYYVGLSAIVREYLEDGLSLRAPEMTTEEFLSAAARDHQLSAVQQERLAEFLSRADLVKFARHRPGLEESEAAYQAARRFVEETRLPQNQQDQQDQQNHNDPAAVAPEVSDALS